MQPLLEIFKASKSYRTPEGGTITALDDVSLKVSSSEFLTLLGPSGCGKTTMLRTVSGFESLDKGDVAVDGMVVTDMPAYRRPVNTVFQKYALFPHLSVGKNVAYALEVAGTDRRETASRVGAILELVGLGGLERRSIGQLSGGQQQRVALARALIAKPKLLLLDEPLSALDKNLRQKMQKELKNLQSELGIGFIFVTHDQEEALTMSDRIAVLANGKIQQLGKPEELYRRPVNLFAAKFLGESNLFPVDVASGTARLSDGQTVSCDLGCDKATLMIRPEALSLDGHGDNTLAFSGVVRESYYSGKDYTLEIENAALGTIQALVRASERTIEPGVSITLHAEPGQFHFVPEQA
ncbi:ABC transporter ATP-binding protein [Martelella limonii]|uniref:ABC transporter ATP-binding protein n=1 Tax=Martelella limonii TaxID=1647649 RepID=UPI001580AEC8|nr:ABC transporter ATP-binding protein [Martelella limonii]